MTALMASTEEFLIRGNIVRFLDRLAGEESAENSVAISKILRDEVDKFARTAAHLDGLEGHIERIDELMSQLRSRCDGKIGSEGAANLFDQTLQNLSHVRANFASIRDRVTARDDKLQHL